MGEATARHAGRAGAGKNFNPRFPWGKRPRAGAASAGRTYFNPRFPWGKRPEAKALLKLNKDFNPRFPWGKRPKRLTGTFGISNFNPRFPWGKRLLALEMQITRRIFQSTLPVGEATGADADLKRQLSISIHASRGGSDRGRYRRRGGRYYFNPRFPWGKRLHPVGRYNLRRHFNPRFPWGKRRARQGETRIIKIFQSTLPVGEATNTDRPQFRAMLISIHASRGGSDAAGIDGEGGDENFNPRFPWGKRHRSRRS